MKRFSLHPGHRQQLGLSLMELLVAMTLGFILLAGIVTVYISSKQTYRTQEANARVQETGRFALDIISRSLRQAGAQGSMPADINATPASCVSARPCTSSGTCGAVTGAPVGTTCDLLGGVCIATNLQCFALQGVEGDSGAPDALAAQFYVGVQDEVNCKGETGDANDVITNVFYLDTTELELECQSRIVHADGVTDPTASSAQPLVDNVEDLQVLYGLDADGSKDQSADTYVAAPTAAQWPLVVTARVCIQVRSDEQGVVAGSTRHLNCAGALGTVTDSAAFTTPTDTRLHRVFMTTVNLRNRISNHP